MYMPVFPKSLPVFLTKTACMSDKFCQIQTDFFFLIHFGAVFWVRAASVYMPVLLINVACISHFACISDKYCQKQTTKT